MGQASKTAGKTAARAARAWRLVLVGGLFAAGAALIYQQSEIARLERLLEARGQAAAPAGVAAQAVPVLSGPPAFARPVSESSSFDARRQSQQHYLSGVIYFQQGDYVKARDEWVLAKQDDPSNQDASAGLERVDAVYAGH